VAVRPQLRRGHDEEHPEASHLRRRGCHGLDDAVGIGQPPQGRQSGHLARTQLQHARRLLLCPLRHRQLVFVLPEPVVRETEEVERLPGVSRLEDGVVARE